MLKNITKEEWQLICLYRKVKNPVNRYNSAVYMSVLAKDDTGKREDIPDALAGCDAVYTAYCKIYKDVKETFPEDMQEKQLADLWEITERDMISAYKGDK